MFVKENVKKLYTSNSVKFKNQAKSAPDLSVNCLSLIRYRKLVSVIGLEIVFKKLNIKIY